MSKFKAYLIKEWALLKQDFKERFLNFETVKGIYLIPAGVLVVFMAMFHVSFVIQTAFGVLGALLVVEGLRKILVNRTKQAVAQDALRAQRDAITAAPAVPVAPTIPLQSVK